MLNYVKIYVSHSPRKKSANFITITHELFVGLHERVEYCEHKKFSQLRLFLHLHVILRSTNSQTPHGPVHYFFKRNALLVKRSDAT